MDYKQTLHMPQTDFEMRGNLAKKEPGILKQWQQNNYYHEILKHHEGEKAFILHDGPPYANGNLHAGTAMNRSIKDFIVRSHAMLGFYTPFFPGWDTHGLPTENAIQKLGVDRKKITAAEFRKKCDEFVHTQISQQMETEQRLGQVADYEHPYITLLPEFEERQVKTFGKMASEGMIFQGLKPVYWSPFNETAVADSEIVYRDVKDATIYLAFQIADGKGVLDSDDYFVIWTTTPWTIPSNEAVCLNENLEYAEVQTEKGKLVFLAKFVDQLLAKFNLENQGVLRTFKGRELEGITYHHVVLDKECPTLLGKHVTDEDGTGVVHTAGGHGLDDFLVCAKYGIAPINTVDYQGNMNEEAGKYQGMFFEDCSKAVIHDMNEKGCLLAVENITHSYPHDDRLKKKVIFRAVKQWFCSIDKLKPQLLDEIDNKITWHNSFGQKRMHNMIADRGDWCISRQRLWGVPIPIIYNEDGSPIMELEVFNHIAELFGKYGSNYWFEHEAKDLLPEGYTNPKSPNGKYTKEKDIMDVWFDSGSSWNELQARGYDYPCDLYFEGSDQYRGWFNSSLIVSTAVNGTAPYKEVLSHGYVVDSKGEKMSKSVGNVVNPMDIINKYGADILRLWAASEAFKADMRIGDSNLKQVSDQYRKIRNTFRFLLGVTSDFDGNLVAYENLEPIDKYMLISLNDMLVKVKNAYDNYDFVQATNTMTNFMTNELSSYYCDYAKDILYCDEGERRRQVQSVLYQAIDVLVKLWSPVLVFTTEEVYSFFRPNEDSVHYTHFPKEQTYPNSDEVKADFAKLHVLRDAILKALEEARQNKTIGKSLEAHVTLNISDEDKALLEKNFKDKVNQWLIVSKVDYTSEDLPKYDDFGIKVEKVAGVVCPRCWNITDSTDPEGLCDRCKKVLSK